MFTLHRNMSNLTQFLTDEERNTSNLTQFLTDEEIMSLVSNRPIQGHLVSQLRPHLPRISALSQGPRLLPTPTHTPVTWGSAKGQPHRLSTGHPLPFSTWGQMCPLTSEASIWKCLMSQWLEFRMPLPPGCPNLFFPSFLSQRD